MDISIDMQWVPGLLALLVSAIHCVVGCLLAQSAERRSAARQASAGFAAGAIGVFIATAVYFILGIKGIYDAF